MKQVLVTVIVAFVCPFISYYRLNRERSKTMVKVGVRHIGQKLRSPLMRKGN